MTSLVMQINHWLMLVGFCRGLHNSPVHKTAKKKIPVDTYRLSFVRRNPLFMGVSIWISFDASSVNSHCHVIFYTRFRHCCRCCLNPSQALRYDSILFHVAITIKKYKRKYKKCFLRRKWLFYTVKIAKAILTVQQSRSRFSGFGTLNFNNIFLWDLG